jgi:glycosyltransferase involved in cell wall biosynthesis
MLPLTLLVITHNEAANIARCLDSVPFAAEKVVVDSGSSDDTVAIASAHGARVVHQDWLGFGPQRNFASTQASHDWILVLDADEYLDTSASFAAARTTWARRCGGTGRWWARKWRACITADARAGPTHACTNHCAGKAAPNSSARRSTTCTTRRWCTSN